jgi:hypothetical protein
MKIRSLLLMGTLSLLFGSKSAGQSNLIDITSKSEEGFHDLVFNIIEKQLGSDNNWIIVAKGQCNNRIVGLKLVLKNGINAGIVDRKPNNQGMVKNAGRLLSIGSKSDNFIKIVSALYGFKTDKKFSKKGIFFDCFSLNEQAGYLDKGKFKFKLFFDSYNKIDLYSEMFLDIDISSGLIELNEKDPGYRENIVKILCNQ